MRSLSSCVVIRKPIDIKLYLLIFMAGIYPLIVVPIPLNYFYLPKYITLTLVSSLSLVVLLREKIKCHSIYIPLLLFLLFSVISTILAPDPVTAWIGMVRYTGFSTYFFCIILFLLASQTKKSEVIINYFIGGAVIVSVLAVLQHFGLNLVPHEPFRAGYHSFGTLANPNFLGTYTSFILPAVIVLFLTYQNKVYLFSSAVIYACLLVTLTRGAWLAFSIAMLIITVKYFTSNRRQLLVQFLVLLLITLVLLPTNNWQIRNRVFGISNEITSAANLENSAGSGRMFLWKETIKLIPKYWAFGIGPDHLVFANIVQKDSPYDKAHNIFLEILVTFGIFSLISYVIFLSFFFRFRSSKDTFFYTIMILTYILQGLFNIDVVLVMPLFWIVLGLSFSRTEQNNSINFSMLCKVVMLVFTLALILPFSLGYFHNYTDIIKFRSTDSYQQNHSTLETESTYVGETKLGEPHGFGTWTSPTGLKYIGQFKDGRFHGEGKWILPNGHTFYQGQLFLSQFHGKGTMIWEDGSEYTGEFQNGLFHGRGRFVYPNGQIKDGFWENGIYIKGK